MSEWFKNVGGVNQTQNLHQLKAAEMDEYINSIYNYKEPKNVVSGDKYFDAAEKITLGKMMNCVIADAD